MPAQLLINLDQSRRRNVGGEIDGGAAGRRGDRVRLSFQIPLQNRRHLRAGHVALRRKIAVDAVDDAVFLRPCRSLFRVIGDRSRVAEADVSRCGGLARRPPEHHREVLTAHIQAGAELSAAHAVDHAGLHRPVDGGLVGNAHVGEARAGDSSFASVRPPEAFRDNLTGRVGIGYEAAAQRVHQAVFGNIEHRVGVPCVLRHIRGDCRRVDGLRQRRDFDLLLRRRFRYRRRRGFACAAGGQ